MMEAQGVGMELKVLVRGVGVVLMVGANGVG